MTLASGNTMNPTDQLVAGFQEGDQAAFELLFERYHRRIYTLAYRILGNEQEAEDIVQETFLKAFRTLAHFRGDSSFETWLIAIAVNASRDRMRRRKIRRAISLDGLAPLALRRLLKRVHAEADDPAAATGRRERRRALWEAVAQLDMRLRLPILLRYGEGLSCSEIAEVLDLSLSTVYTQLSDGRKLLRRTLEGDGYEIEK
jgi:RNA polymerase sigma-70 factor (ECF subfamily)